MKTSVHLRRIVVALACLLSTAIMVRAAEATTESKPILPRLVDLGAGRCIPCRQMKPILEELKRDYGTQFQTIFIDVWENRDEGKRYGIQIIPTQIFYDAGGKELFRHEGFMAKKDILAKWQELGVALNPPATPVGS